MGIISRTTTLLKAKISRKLDEAEDPSETLDYSYNVQLEQLRKVQRGVVEMVASKKRIQIQADKVRNDIPRLERQAEDALSADREDLARLALQRKQEAVHQLEGLDQQLAGMEEQQRKLVKAEANLKAKIESFRNQKEVIKAQYSAAQAQVRIGEAVSGVSEEMSDVSLAMTRAEEKTNQMQAKASAIDELADTGVLDTLGGPVDDIEKQLREISASSSVDSEIAAIKARREAEKAAAETSEPTDEPADAAEVAEPVGAAASPSPNRE